VLAKQIEEGNFRFNIGCDAEVVKKFGILMQKANQFAQKIGQDDGDEDVFTADEVLEEFKEFIEDEMNLNDDKVVANALFGVAIDCECPFVAQALAESCKLLKEKDDRLGAYNELFAEPVSLEQERAGHEEDVRGLVAKRKKEREKASKKKKSLFE